MSPEAVVYTYVPVDATVAETSADTHGTIGKSHSGS